MIGFNVIRPALVITAGIAVVCALGGCDVKGRAAVSSGDEGPLVDASIAPSHLNRIRWFFVANRLLTPADDHYLACELFDVIRGSVAYVSFQRPRDAKLAPMGAWPFAVGLEDGTVLLVDELRLWADQRVSRKVISRLLAMVPETVRFREGAASELAITPNRDLRLAVPRWTLLSVWDASAMSWVPPQASGPSLRARVDAFLAMTRRIHFLDTRPDAPGWARENVPSGDGQTSAPSCQVSFAKPVELLVIETTYWDPYYYLDESHSASVSGKVQSLTVQVAVATADRAAIIPEHRNEDTARVFLRLTGSNRWINAGIVPLKYP